MTKIIWIVTILVFSLGCIFSYHTQKKLPELPVAAGSPNSGGGIVKEGSDSARRPNNAQVPRQEMAGGNVNAPTGGDVKRVEKRGPVFPSNGNTRTALSQIRVRLRYNALYAKLGLSPEAIQRFEASAAENYSAIDPFSVELGRYPREQENEMLRLAMAGLEQIVADSLGSDKAQAFRDFVATSDLQSVADKLAINTFYTDAPLTADQAGAFVELCLRNRMTTDPSLRIDQRTVNWEQVVNQSRAILSQSQQSALQAMLDIMAFDQEFQKASGLPYRRPVRGF